MKIYFLIRVVLQGLLLGILFSAIQYFMDQREHPGASTYDYFAGFLINTLAGTIISLLGWQVERYFLRKHGKEIPE